jgi:anaerobic magnesium-protoporphyrin IX monomethyl ester cyclase
MPFRFGLVSILNPDKNFALNKDLNGGLGTADDYQGGGVAITLARYIKKRAVRLPVLSFAYLQAILRSRSHYVKYFEGTFPDPKKDFFDVILLHGTIVDYRYERHVARKMRNLYPQAKIGFFGDFPTIKPELFSDFAFVIQGEAEEFFLNNFMNLADLSGNIRVGFLKEMDQLPTPDLDGFLLNQYGYSLSPFRKRFMTLLSSKGCPYDCRYYCAYGQLQGPTVRQRSADKVINDLKVYKERYGIKVVQFRDPVFGIKEGFIKNLCEALIENRIDIRWGIETRLEILDEYKLRLMYRAGLRQINVGIETAQKSVADKNHRQLIKYDRQKEILDICKRIGIRVAAFYLFGLEGETKLDMLETLNYAKGLNTPIARFSIVTPYPGTDFFHFLEAKGRIVNKEFEQYTQFNLVFSHPAITHSEIVALLKQAYISYYIRFAYLIEIIKTKINSSFRYKYVFQRGG